MLLRETGVKLSVSEVGRILRNEDFRPHKMRLWLHSPDPDFCPKVQKICDLYHHPPDGAHVICVDEKTGMHGVDVATYSPSDLGVWEPLGRQQHDPGSLNQTRLDTRAPRQRLQILADGRRQAESLRSRARHADEIVFARAVFPGSTAPQQWIQVDP